MHGIIFFEFRKFGLERLGQLGWEGLLASERFPDQPFTPVETRPDAELTRLVLATGRATGRSAHEVLEDFGAFLVPDLLSVYAPLILPAWTMKDVLLNVETLIHRAVRIRDAAATPPELESTLNADGAVEIFYRSQRRLCSLAKGLILGLSAHYRQPIVLEQMACMNEGEEACRLRVTMRDG